MLRYDYSYFNFQSSQLSIRGLAADLRLCFLAYVEVRFSHDGAQIVSLGAHNDKLAKRLVSQKSAGLEI